MSAQYHIPPPSREEAPEVKRLADAASVYEMTGGSLCVGMGGEYVGSLVKAADGAYSAHARDREAPVATGAPYIGALQALALCKLRRGQ